MATSAINFIYLVQLIAIVGAGFLAQPITELFGASSLSVWPSSILTIFTSVLTPPISQAADYWGRKWFLVVLMACGCAGSLVIGWATSMGMVIGGFCLLGLSFGSQSLLFAVVSEVLPRKHRPVAQSTVNLTAGLGAAAGLIMGGALLRNNILEHYRVYWYVVAGIFMVSSILCFCFYNPPPREAQVSLSTSEKLHRLDWVGIGTFSPGLTLFCVGLAWSQNPYEWSNAHILAPFITGVMLLIFFIVYEWRWKRDGMLHHDLFKKRNFPISLALVFAEGLSFFTCNNYYPFEVSLFTGGSFWTIGLHFTIVFFGSVAFAPLAGLYSGKKKVVRSPLFVGLLCLVIFNVLMATVNLDSPRGTLWGYAIFAGAGLGMILPIVMVAAQMDTPPELISITSGLITSIRSVGAAIGLAINTATIHNSLAKNLVPKIAAAILPLGFPEAELPAIIAALVTQSPAAVEAVPGVTPTVSLAALVAYKEAYGIAFRNAWITASCIVFVAAIEFNAHIDAPAEGNFFPTKTEIEAGPDHEKEIPQHAHRETVE
ncbi:Tannase [Penicillium atrosanguineum]|uniref:Tannase n=1 Tax=Penicillium atrosanguineum TaxID=1132637 RepID=UPI0023946438|nr:Tannase [Penicillium atrosanguineum]KAJ5292764.1 Tannase [Penicillium atrosanguineum]